MSQWKPEVTQRIQEILDRSAATATPVVGRVFARDDWRLSAEQFLDAWKEHHMCAVATTGPKGQPHLAIIETANFDDDGKLTMRMYEGSVRQKDLAANPRIALTKSVSRGPVLTVYGRATETPDSGVDGYGGTTVESVIEITRIYAMVPKREGPSHHG